MLISAFRIAYTGDVLTALAPFVMCLSNDEELWLAPTRLHLSLLQSSPFDNVQDMTLSCLFLPAFTFETFHWCFDGSLQRLRDLKLDRPISCRVEIVSSPASRNGIVQCSHPPVGFIEFPDTTLVGCGELERVELSLCSLEEPPSTVTIMLSTTASKMFSLSDACRVPSSLPGESSRRTNGRD